jgi:hypothetical protein
VQRRQGVRAFPKRVLPPSKFVQALMEERMTFPGYLSLAFCRVTRTDLIPPRGPWNGPRR